MRRGFGQEAALFCPQVLSTQHPLLLLLLTLLMSLPPVAVCSWKTIVVNTPRTLQEILPALMAEVIDALADAGGAAGT